jgi:hypothetical protein
MAIQPVVEPTASRVAMPGFSLTELLVASAIGLAVMGAVATLLSTIGSTTRNAEAIVAMTDGLRTASAKLRDDLTGITADVMRGGMPAAGAGYFEYIEGARRDYDPAYSGLTPAADTDDILLFTTRALGKPFVGRFTTFDGSGPAVVSSFESPYAEVAWFCKEAPDVEQTVSGLRMHRLYRRQLLVTAYVGIAPFVTTGTANVLSGTAAANLQALYSNYDLSLRRLGASLYAPNSLADLTRRENRFLHGEGSGFPYIFAGGTSVGATFDTTLREGEDVVLGNVIGFDVRAFDPEASLMRVNASGIILQPGDPGYGLPAIPQQAIATGAFVDLGWGRQVTVTGTFPNPILVSATRSPLPLTAAFPPMGNTAFQSDGVRVANNNVGFASLVNATYDTWSSHYEFNGYDDNANAAIDEGANGVDDNGDGVPDDPAENETSAPYPVPLRGIEVRIRCYDQTSKQIRQITIRHSFVRK